MCSNTQKLVLVSSCLFASMVANATVLTFDITGAADGSVMPQSYGDNVTATTMGNFSYGSAHGFTPDITTSYVGLGGQADLNWWSNGYGDLTNVIEYEPDGAPGFSVDLLASSGLVELHGFDMGNWGSDITVASVKVMSGTNTLFSQSNVFLPGGSTHVDFDFTTPLSAASMSIVIDLTGLGGSSDNVGLDNIAFGQAVPEPTTMAILGAGVFTLLKRRRK